MPLQDETARATVLVIDDERATRDLLGDALAREGYRVVTAPGGRNGLRLAKETRPDAVILDVIMPDVDGWTGAALAQGRSRALRDPGDPRHRARRPGDGHRARRGRASSASPSIRLSCSARLDRVCRGVERPQVLVVDDDPATRDVLRRTLTKEGWIVREATNGQEGLAELAKARPAVMLLDLMMPQMNGFEVLRTVRESTDLQDLPVVVITSKDLTRDELAWLRGKALQIFQKGTYGRAELLTSLRTMIEAARRPSVEGRTG